MDMKRILEKLDQAGSKPAVDSNDMKKFVSIVNEGANPHKVALPVQMAMQHYQDTPVEVPASNSLFKKYFAEAQEVASQEAIEKQQQLAQYAQRIAKKVLEGRGRDSWDSNMPGYQGDYGGAANWGRREREDDEHHHLDREAERQDMYGLWYIKVDGKILRAGDQPQEFVGKDAAKAAAQEQHNQARDPETKKSPLNIVLTMRPEDDAEQSVEEDSTSGLAQQQIQQMTQLMQQAQQPWEKAQLRDRIKHVQSGNVVNKPILAPAEWEKNTDPTTIARIISKDGLSPEYLEKSNMIGRGLDYIGLPGQNPVNPKLKF